MISASCPKRIRSDLKGFSLIECVLALGVVGFVLVPIVGLLSVGLDLFRDSMSRTINAQISHQIFAELQQADFDNLASSTLLSNSARYFDSEGIEIEPYSPYAYSAVVLPATPAVAGANSEMGMASGASARVFNILIAANSDLAGVSSLSDAQAKTGPRLTVVPALISKMGL